MKRREFLAVAAALLVSTRPLPAQRTPRRIGFLTTFQTPQSFIAWRSGLFEKGWVEGKNLLVEYRSDQRLDRLPALAAELVAQTPDLLIASGPQAAIALKSHTATIPIVFVVVADPVGIGLVQSLSHPGGNITGLTTFVPGDFVGKQIEILREFVPGAAKIAILANPNNAIHTRVLAEEIPREAQNLGIALPTVEATTAEELDIAFSSAVAQRVDAIVVFADALTIRHAPRVVALALEHHLPAVYLFRLFVDAGGLSVYGPDALDIWRRAGGYVDKLLKGAKPSDLPVEQPTKFELVINMKTAKALGLTVPPSLLVRANELVE